MLENQQIVNHKLHSSWQCCSNILFFIKETTVQNPTSSIYLQYLVIIDKYGMYTI